MSFKRQPILIPNQAADAASSTQPYSAIKQAAQKQAKLRRFFGQDNPLPPHSDGVNLCAAELLYYQKQNVPGLSPNKSIWSLQNGQHGSKKLGRGMDFSEVRPYQAGDDVRSIDWRVTARTGTVHTKLFTQERERPQMLLIDLSSSMKFGSSLLLKSVQASHLAALLSWMAIRQNDRIGAIILTDTQLFECKPTARQQGALSLIQAMVSAHSAPATNKHAFDELAQNWQRALRHLQRLCPKGSEITLISDFYKLSEQDLLPLRQLNAHNRTNFVRILDPLEQGETDFRGVEWVGDHQQNVWLNFASTHTRDSFAQQDQEHVQFLSQFTRSIFSPLLTLSAAAPLIQQLEKVACNRTY
ncbi:MAG: DUF58 domain-containing protein [Vibrionaceae bacterium]